MNDITANDQIPPNPRAGGRRVVDPPSDADRRELLERAAAALPDDARPQDIAARAIQMRQEETGCTWTELVDSGWTFGADEAARILQR